VFVPPPTTGCGSARCQWLVGGKARAQGSGQGCGNVAYHHHMFDSFDLFPFCVLVTDEYLFYTLIRRILNLFHFFAFYCQNIFDVQFLHN